MTDEDRQKQTKMDRNRQNQYNIQSLFCPLRGCFCHRQSRFEQAFWSLATIVRSHCSIHSLTPQLSASLHSLTLFTGSLAHLAHSLVGKWKFLNMCSCCKRVQWYQTRFSSSLETRPDCHRMNGSNVFFSEKSIYFKSNLLLNE